MSVLINNLNHGGINSDAIGITRALIEPVIESARPQNAAPEEPELHFKAIFLLLIFVGLLFSQEKTLRAESNLEQDILTVQSGTIERAKDNDENTSPTHTDELRNNFIDLANSLSEIASPSVPGDEGIAEEAHTDASPTDAIDDTDNLRNSFIDLANSLNEIASPSVPGDEGIAAEAHTEAIHTDAIDDTDNLRNSFIDLSNSLKKITSTPVPADEYVAEEEPENIGKPIAEKPVSAKTSIATSNTDDEKAKLERTISTEITTDNNELIQHDPTTVKLVSTDKQDEILKPVTSSTEPVATFTGTKSAYNKYDAQGNLLDNESEQWACIHDTSNDLMWEVKSKDDALRNTNNLYSWFDPKNKNLKGKPDGGRCEGGTACDTNAYVQAMNEKNFCGHNDWHLPTRLEMQTLVYLNNQDDPVKINKQYFPETVPSWYWTASENDESNDFAWYVLFRNGVALNDLKERPKHIRLVRNNSSQ